MSIERELKKLEKQVLADAARMDKEMRQMNENLEAVAATDQNQLCVAISLGVTLSRIENGITIASKIEGAEATADSDPPTVMQKAVLQQMKLNAPKSANRAEVSYLIIEAISGKHHRFLHSLSSTFQDRFCGGPISRFDVVPTFSPKAHGVLSLFGMAWRVVKFVVITVLVVLALTILLAVVSPKAVFKEADTAPTQQKP